MRKQQSSSILAIITEDGLTKYLVSLFTNSAQLSATREQKRNEYEEAATVCTITLGRSTPHNPRMPLDFPFAASSRNRGRETERQVGNRRLSHRNQELAARCRVSPRPISFKDYGIGPQ
jgi:hypothetical protein